LTNPKGQQRRFSSRTWQTKRGRVRATGVSPDNQSRFLANPLDLLCESNAWWRLHCMQRNSNQCVVYQQPNKRYSQINTPALEDQCWNPPTRALRDGELRAALTLNKTNSQFSKSEDDGVPRKLRCGKITSTQRMALLAQKQRTKPGPLTEVKRKRAHASSEKKQVALTF
jgi:hypothetical protein